MITDCFRLKQHQKVSSEGMVLSTNKHPKQHCHVECQASPGALTSYVMFQPSPTGTVLMPYKVEEILSSVLKEVF